MGSIYLQTDRMELREFTMDDAETLVALDSDPEVMRFVSAGAPTPIEVIRDEILPKFMRFYGDGSGLGGWVAVDRDTQEFLGWFHLRPFDPDPSALDLGYRFARWAWDRGLATEGSRALIAKGFGQLSAERIVAKTMRANRASQRVMEKAGLPFDSDYVEDRFPGEDKAAVLHSLTREEYEAQTI